MTAEPTADPISLRTILASLGQRTLLEALRAHYGLPELVAHWTQGEFHHDLVFHFAPPSAAPAPYVVASTNCNGGVKTLLALAEAPSRFGLWHWRCPDNPEFEGTMPEIVESVRHIHWFDPCALLTDDARSELRPEARRRQRGGGWVPLDSTEP